MAKTRVKNIDRPMCLRVRTAFKRLGMTYEGLSADSGISSKAQLTDIANGRIEPSKRVLKYLCSKGFSAHWLLTGTGHQLWLGQTGNREVKKLIVGQIKKDIQSLNKTVSVCTSRLAEFQAVLADITDTLPATGQSGKQKPNQRAPTPRR